VQGFSCGRCAGPRLASPWPFASGGVRVPLGSRSSAMPTRRMCAAASGSSHALTASTRSRTDGETFAAGGAQLTPESGSQRRAWCSDRICGLLVTIWRGLSRLSRPNTRGLSAGGRRDFSMCAVWLGFTDHSPSTRFACPAGCRCCAGKWLGRALRDALTRPAFAISFSAAACVRSQLFERRRRCCRKHLRCRTARRKK